MLQFGAYGQLLVLNSALAFCRDPAEMRGRTLSGVENGSLADIFDSVQSIDLAGSTVKAILDWLGGIVTSSGA
ncbi:hypothetical protein GS470_22435 [Rhodococcus hoagii]|nr:hypothetical protein [Prescottella equi]